MIEAVRVLNEEALFALDRCRDEEVVLVNGDRVACVPFLELPQAVRDELAALGAEPVAFPMRLVVEMSPGGEIPAFVSQWEARADHRIA